MPRRVTLLLAVLLAAVVALAMALVVVARQSGHEPPQPVLSMDLDRTVPSLTVPQRQQVADIAVDDPRIRQLIQEQPAEVAGVVVWTKGTGELIGGVVTLRLTGPRTVQGEWLGLDYDRTEATSPPYTSVPYRAKYSNVTSLEVMVDLDRGQVVGVTPDHDAEAEGTPELPPGFIPSRGGGD